MICRVVSKVIAYGKQRWRLNADGSWSVLAFGSFGPEDVGLRYGWISVSMEKVLKPFAEFSTLVDITRNETTITLQDFMRARQALKAKDGK